MQITRVSRGDKNGDNVYISINNVSGQTITTGWPVAYAISNSADGLNTAVLATTAGVQPGFLGVAVQDIANNDIGRVQIAGFVNSVLLSNVGTSLTINAGDPLVPGPAGFFSAAPTYVNSGFRWLFASNVPPAVSAASYASGLMKML